MIKSFLKSILIGSLLVPILCVPIMIENNIVLILYNLKILMLIIVGAGLAATPFIFIIDKHMMVVGGVLKK